MTKLRNRTVDSVRGAISIGTKSAKPEAKRAGTSISRRRFLHTGLAVGAGTIGTSLLPNAAQAAGGLTPGDAAILRFLAAAEILETDAWQQYNELGGIQDREVPGGSGSAPYTAALQVLDADMPQYIHDNTEDEFTHFTFIDAYLASKGAKPVNLDQFRTLPSSKATGAQQIGRLTNLMQLTVDTSWWPRYRSRTKTPDFGAAFAQAVPGLSAGQFPAIPRTDADLAPSDHLQAIANTAGLPLPFIGQGGTSPYPPPAPRGPHTAGFRIPLRIGAPATPPLQTLQHQTAN